MTIEAIVAKYGLAALFAGAALEGEAAVVAGGVLAHQQYFPLWAAMIAAATGSFCADQAWFFAGRRMRDHRWVAAARARPAFARALMPCHATDSDPKAHPWDLALLETGGADC